MIPRGRKYAALISRFGESVEIHEKVEGGKNVFNNPQPTWTHTDNTTCAVVKPEDTTKMDVAGGERQTSSTSLFFPKDVSLPSNFRIKRELTGATFEIENVTERRSHVEAEAVEI